MFLTNWIGTRVSGFVQVIKNLESHGLEFNFSAGKSWNLSVEHGTWKWW